MRKEKYKTVKINGDVSAIYIDILNGDVNLKPVDGDCSVVKKLRTHVKITLSGGELHVRQTRKTRLKKAEAEISVPSHCLPELYAKGEKCNFKIEGGLFGNSEINFVSGDVSVRGAAFEKLAVSCNQLNFASDSATVKTCAIVNSGEGKALIEGGFASSLDVHIIDGDIGVTGQACKDAQLFVEKGSINANFMGKPEEYSLSALAKNGTCNRENRPEGEKSIKAYAGSGNIVIDFTDDSKTEAQL